jgi:tetratricopeptide (TPR) repeat protein
MKKYSSKIIYGAIVLIFFSCEQEKSAQYYFSLAVKEFKSEDYHKAFELFSKAIEHDSTFGHAYFMRAQILGLLQADKDSICENLKKAEEYGYPEAKEVFEKYCKEIPIDEFNKLKARFDSYIESNPDRFEGYFNRANLYFDIQKFENAIDDYSSVIERNEYPVAYYNRGLCYLQLGLKQEGCNDIKKSAELGYVVTKELLESMCIQPMQHVQRMLHSFADLCHVFVHGFYAARQSIDDRLAGYSGHTAA